MMNSRMTLPSSLSAVLTIPATTVTSLLGQLMIPVAAAGYAMAVWRFAADMNWFGEFIIPSGLFSRWQVWLALAIATQAAAGTLNRTKRPDDHVA
ncbi:MAG: hypothetical protein H7Y20_12520 [Bryobacteraceae bacterium]|nr:hypothetical protein [Bryobacteraceae bacterium]